MLGTQADNDYFGLDVATWAREGLIDTLIPYSPAPLALPVAEDTWTSGGQIQPFVEAVRGTRCLMAPNLMPRDLSAEDYRRMASMLYAAGAEHLFVWDCAGSWFRANCQAPWNALRRLGHRDEIEAWKRAGKPSLANPTVPIRRLGGWGHDDHRPRLSAAAAPWISASGERAVREPPLPSECVDKLRRGASRSALLKLGADG